MAMALSDGVNSSGENRRKILRRFMVRKNKKDTIKGTTELSKMTREVKEFKLTFLTFSILSINVVVLHLIFILCFLC